VIAPGKCKIGIMPSHVFTPGNVGILSRSGTLTYEIASTLTKKRIGQSTCVGIGGDPVVGLNFVEALDRFREDPQTEVVVLIGEIGGNLEELTANHLAETDYPKPVVAYVAGRSAPPGKRMGHAGAIIMGKAGSAQSKIAAFKNVGARVAEKPADVADLVGSALKK
jgi:succinyl-CoA synthetase alpha subunit